MLREISDSFYNFLGWKTNRKLIIIASDDWGSIRVESAEIRKQLIEGGFNMDGNRFNRFDTLESNADLEALFDVLSKFTDSHGNHPVITAMTNVANPDFYKIESDGFRQYYREPFTATLAKYPGSENVIALYQQGISSQIFVPQFHGREHLNVSRWMRALQLGHETTRKAFDSRFYMPDLKDLPGLQHGFGAAFDVDDLAELSLQKEILNDGLALFSETFGYRATFFTAPSLTFNNAILTTLAENGITMVDVPKLRKMPIGGGSGRTSINFTGKKAGNGMRYVTRNAVFEPNMSVTSDGVQACLKDISKAFANRQPAVISNHRAAFSGSIDPGNRTRGLSALKDLLAQIIKKWPDAEFITVKQLQDYITNDK